VIQVTVRFPGRFVSPDIKGWKTFKGDHGVKQVSKWPRAEQYEIFEREGAVPIRDEPCPIIAPHPDCEYPEDFDFYDPGEEDIYRALMDIDDPNDPEQFLEFANDYGLLGVGFDRKYEERFFPYGHIPEDEYWLRGASRKPDIDYNPKQDRGYEFFHLFGEYIGETDEGASMHNASGGLGKFQKIARFLEGNLAGEDCNIHRDVLCKLNFSDEMKNGKLFEMDSLLNVGIVQLVLNQQELSACPECHTIFLPDNVKGRSQRFCTSRCRDNYNHRRNKQRDAWEETLTQELSGVDWPTTDPNNPRHNERYLHPVERIDELSGEVKRLAIKWAKETAQRSTRSEPDPLLEPIISLEEE
jgi:hypothetical protein